MRSSFHIWHGCSLWQGLSNGTINVERVTLTVTFALLLKNFNIDHNFFILKDRPFIFGILKDRAFIFGICVPYDKAFPIVP